MKSKSTPDERFLMQLYQTALALGDPFSEISYPEIAASLGIKEIALKSIIRDLAQANFLKKVGDRTVQLTERGFAVARATIENR